MRLRLLLRVSALRFSDADIGFDPERVNMGLEADDFKLYNPDGKTEKRGF